MQYKEYFSLLLGTLFPVKLGKYLYKEDLKERLKKRRPIVYRDKIKAFLRACTPACIYRRYPLGNNLGFSFSHNHAFNRSVNLPL